MKITSVCLPTTSSTDRNNLQCIHATFSIKVLNTLILLSWRRTLAQCREFFQKCLFFNLCLVLLFDFENSNQIKLLEIASNCIELIIWLKQDKIGSNWIKLDQIGRKQNKLDQTWSNWIKLIKLDQIGINWIKLDPIG